PCIRNRRVRWGDLVRIDFMAWLEDGTLFASTLFRKPLVFMTGRRSVMRGVEELVIGMSAGESKTERIPPALAFGCHKPERIFHVSRDWLTRHAVIPTVGMRLAIEKNNRTLFRALISALSDEWVTLDTNHRLAGKTIMVQIDLLENLGRSGLGSAKHVVDT
ncbi:MAG: FKBP-type peptidyl-prolyl cis-trans isomerase, partial [Nitrospira sp.]|nr:FKBP-type peptidyl-prolyl cis-trans isomerase [Nitrospira sp.]